MPTTIQPPESAAAPEAATTAFALQASLGTALDAALGNTWAATPGQSTAQLLSSGQAVLDTAQLQTPGQLTPGQLTPGQLTPGKLTPGQLTQLWNASIAAPALAFWKASRAHHAALAASLLITAFPAACKIIDKTMSTKAAACTVPPPIRPDRASRS